MWPELLCKREVWEKRLISLSTPASKLAWSSVGLSEGAELMERKCTSAAKKAALTAQHLPHG